MTSKIVDQAQTIAQFQEFTKHLRDAYSNRGAIISLAGPDGAGKTTLVGQLHDVLTQSDLPAERIHCYAWYKHIFTMPFRLAKLKTENRIVILDRSLIDNVIEISRKLHLPNSLVRPLLIITKKLFLNFDVLFVLIAPYDELVSRRPDEKKNKIKHQLQLYRLLSSINGFKTLLTDKPVFDDAVQYITNSKSQ